ncbi:MAG: phosphoenolpyruvate synthase [Candidatus Aenigmarchaeota archaeon]|nr:phosphoenolpyruvate synthase [Candidatus Aenigmarchaeota archaeon]
MEYIVWLDETAPASLLGGKAKHLTEMVRLKLPVPSGFVITTKAFDKFLEINKIKDSIQKMIEECDVKNTSQLLETSKRIKELIVSQEYPLSVKNEIIEAYESLTYSEIGKKLEIVTAGRDFAIVAVRSSAVAEDLPTASFAGQQASFLNVKGVRELLDSVKKCWASLYEPRAIFYRANQGIKHTSIAVIVQKMVNAEKSGVMFTVNPSTSENEIVIEACWGLGETLVSGAVQPDSYFVSKDGRVLKKKIGIKERMRIRDYATDRTAELPVPKDKREKQVLTDEEISRLAQYGILLENHYGRAQDIEFAIEKNRIYIVQTRAVTTEAKIEKVEIKAEPLLKGLGVSPGIVSGTVRIVHGLEDLAKVEKGDVLVTAMTSPDMVVAMSKSAAIITDSGGATCHAAIVSREMRIPAVVGTQAATKVLKDGQIVTVDAYRGLIYPGKVEVEKPMAMPLELKPTRTQIKVNLAFPEGVEEVAKLADGVGLLRIEHMILKYGKHPAKLVREGRVEEYIQILLDGIKPIAKAFYPKPVWVRTLDARSDELRHLEGGEEEPKEDNPMLGWHGIRRSLDEPELLKAEFEVMKRLHEEGLSNMHVMLPFVISVDEFRKVREIAKEMGLPETCKLGIMVEVPSCALTIEDFCKEGIAFASIGSNDLTMMTLGVDRNNAKISSLYSETHPAVLKLIKHTIETCNKYNIESSICGEAPSNIPEMVEFLVKCKIKSISVNIDAIQRTREIVHSTEKKC